MLPLLGQIIRLLKSIRLRPHDPTQRPSSQFGAGKPSIFRFSMGIGLNWWYSADTFLHRKA